MQIQPTTQKSGQPEECNLNSGLCGYTCGPFPVWLIMAAVVLCMGMMIAVTFRARSYLGSPDAFYYLSIADNWLQNGFFLDGTTTPNGPVVTPQNGIVGIFCLLRMLSLTKHQCLLTVVVINFLLLLSCFYPLTKICKSMGIESRAILACILLVFVGSLHIFMWLYMAPINDMIFYAGQIWLIYLLTAYMRRSNDPGDKSSRRLFAVCVLLAVILIHFRLNILFAPMGAFAAAVMTRRFRLLLPIAALMSVAAISLSASWLVVDQYEFQASTGGIAEFFGDFRNQMYVLLFRLIPAGLFRDLNQAGNLLYLPFYLALLLAFIQGIRERKDILLIVAFVCAMTFALTVVSGFNTERYIWAVTIFMYILLLRIKLFRTIGVLFVAAVLINSLWSCGYRMSNLNAWQAFADHAPISREDAFILAHRRHRQLWYYTGIQSVFKDLYQWQDLAKAKTVYILGPQEYVDGHLQAMREMAEIRSGAIDSRQIIYWTGECPDLLLYEITVIPNSTAEPLVSEVNSSGIAK